MLLEQDPPATPVEGEWAIEVEFDGTGRSCGGRGWWMVGASRRGPRLQCAVSRLAELTEVLGRRRVIPLMASSCTWGFDGRPDFSRLRPA